VIAIGAARAETARPIDGVRPPAAPETRTALRTSAARTGLGDRDLGLLADLMCREDLIDRLGTEQVEELTRLLDAAPAAQLGGAELRTAIQTAAAHPDRAAARSALLSQLAAPPERAHIQTSWRPPGRRDDPCPNERRPP
jgi:hypothetical protein